MSRFNATELLDRLDDKVVVTSGGANGIGAAFVSFCLSRGANICFGDVDEHAGNELTARLNGERQNRAQAVFVRTNVTKYESIFQLFEVAYKTFGRVDAAVSCAGIQEDGHWFDPNLSVASVRKEPSTRTLDVTLLGTLYFTRVAAVFLRQNKRPDEDKSLTLIASVAAFKDAPGIFVYQAAKHGVLGLMRSLRGYSPFTSDVRINVVCPWMTRTIMTSGIQADWLNAKLPANEPEDVARVIAEIVVSKGLNGKSMYVEGGRAWEIEDNLEGLEPQWLGQEPSRTLNLGQKVLGTGDNWSAGKSRL